MEGRTGDGISLPLREKHERTYGEKGSCSILWSGSRLLIQSLCCFFSTGLGVPMVPFPEEIARISICLAPSWLWGHHLFIHSFGRVTGCLCGYISRASAFCICIRLHLGFLSGIAALRGTGVQLSGPASSHPCLTVAGLKAKVKQDVSSPGLRRWGLLTCSWLSCAGPFRRRWWKDRTSMEHYSLCCNGTLTPLSSVARRHVAATDYLLLLEKQNLFILDF